jgi:excisionase family DNA binding protein
MSRESQNYAGRPFLSVSQLAEATGESTAVWRKRILHRLIPFVRLGRNVRVRREDFDDFCAARLVVPQQAQRDAK